jgi:hypothetical protein
MSDKMKDKIDKICEGDFGCSDIGLLFIWLRPTFAHMPILLDLANFVAHNDERNQGTSFEHVHSYVKNFIEVSEKGGTIFGFQPVFVREEVIENLIEVLKRQNLINKNEDKLRQQKDRIINCLLEIMDEVEFKFKDPRVVRCYLKRDGQKMFFCLNLDLRGPRIKTSPSATIQSNLFN